jgi:hypothetical protein
MNSEPWLMPTCFSPLTSMLPFASTSVTVTVIVPVKSLLLALSPLPSNAKFDVAARFEPSSVLPGRPASALTPNVLLLARPVLVFDFLLASVFSEMTIVSVSPGLRARRSSKRNPLPKPA